MVVIIFAADDAWGIGNASHENGLPWESITEDFKHFQKITKQYGRVVMGRKTWETIMRHLGKPLPGRESYVLSRTLEMPPYPEVTLLRSEEEVVEYLNGEDYAIIGGAETYRSLASQADEIIMTKVHGTFPADCRLDSSLLDGFTEDKERQETLREGSNDVPKVTVHYYVRNA